MRALPVVIALAATAVFMHVVDGSGGVSQSTEAWAEENWKGEFDDICSKTDGAMESAKEELQILITRCDKLKPQLEKLDEAPRKVYMKRLKMAHDLYQYVLDSKNAKEEGK
ncbi:MAG: hypothetical protein HYS23_14495 [Geobacter sp.]|nr:hypothetical protein [Geobacter sp.]